jgi:hypothetical protein
MMLIDRKTFWYQSRMVGGMPLIHPKTGWYSQSVQVPKVLSAAIVLAHPTGQFVISFKSAILV